MNRTGDNRTFQSWRVWLAGVLLAGFVLRLGLGWTLSTDVDELRARLPDQGEYLALAASLIEGNGLVLHDARFEQDVYAHRMPGYPAFVAVLGANVSAVRVTQALLDVSTALAVFLIIRRFMPVRGALLGAVCVAFNPYLIYFSTLVLSETLYTAMLTWGVWMLLQPRGAWVGWALLLVSVYVRPSAIGLSAGMGAVCAFVNHASWGAYDQQVGLLRQRLAPAIGIFLLSLLATVLMLIPWSWRNKVVLGSNVWLTTNGGVTAYDGFNPTQLDKSWREQGGSDQRFLVSMPELKKVGEVERDRRLNSMARQFVSEHPWPAIQLTGMKILRTWSPVPLSTEYGGRSIYVLVGLVYGVPFFGAVLIGLFRPVSRGGLPGKIKLVLLAPALYFTCVHALSVGSLRYRVPVEPVLAVLAVSAIRWKGDGKEMTKPQ